MATITELHYILPLANLTSVLERGILSHSRAAPYKAADVSLQPVQDIRERKIVPGTYKTIHRFANFYFNAQNPMLFLRKDEADTLCVLRVRPEVLQLPFAKVADRNAAVAQAKFYPAPEGVSKLARDVLFGPGWFDRADTEEVQKEKKALRCAEVLVPNGVHPSYIGGMYVVSEKVRQWAISLLGGEFPIPITVNARFFFQTGLSESPAPLSNRRFTALQPFEAPKEIQSIQEIALPAITSSSAPPRQTSMTRSKKSTIPAGQQTLQGFITRKRKIVSEHVGPSSPQRKALRPVLEMSSPSDLRDLPAHITLCSGNLLDSNCQALVNTVNCYGVMGKGLALKFKDAYPEMFADYAEKCRDGDVKPGSPYIYVTKEGRTIVNFPTKDYWKGDSRLEWVQTGLDRLFDLCRQHQVPSIAIPPLGCGNGGLDWQTVKRTIVEKLAGLEGVQIELYEPN